MDCIQFTLTVNAGKWLIAKAISEKNDVQNAFLNGRIVLFGGTTVSAVAELLVDKPLRISGRVNPKGTTTALVKTKEPHTLIIDKGHHYDISDEKSTEILRALGKDDLVITGAVCCKINCPSNK